MSALGKKLISSGNNFDNIELTYSGFNELDWYINFNDLITLY